MSDPVARTDRVCPAAHAGWLSTPLRRLGQDPRRILHGLVTEGERLRADDGPVHMQRIVTGRPAGIQLSLAGILIKVEERGAEVIR